MPGTWAHVGLDADGDRRPDPLTAADAIMSAVRYLKYLGAAADWHRALLGYTHAEWYVARVLDQARAFERCGRYRTFAAKLRKRPADPSSAGARSWRCPVSRGVRVDEWILPDILFLRRERFHFMITAVYATSGH